MGETFSKSSSHKKKKSEDMSQKINREKLFSDYKKKKTSLGMKLSTKIIEKEVGKPEYKAVLKNNLELLKLLLRDAKAVLSLKRYEWNEVVLFWLAVHFK